VTTENQSHPTYADMHRQVVGEMTAQLDRAQRNLAAMAEDNPLRERAEALVADLQGSLSNAERTAGDAMATETGTGALDSIAQHERQLDDMRRGWKDRRNQYAAELAADGRYTAEYRQQMLDAFDAERQAEAEQAARAAWRAYEGAEQALARDMQTAHRESEARFDLGRVGVLVKDYASQVQAPPIPQGMEGDSAHRLRFIAQLLDRAEASGDPDAARAARIAAGPEVRRMMGTGQGEADVLGRELHARLARMADTERGRVVEVERRAAQLRRRGAGLRGSVLGLETAATGKGAGIFGLSPWQVAVLGESMADYGGGVGEVVQR